MRFLHVKRYAEEMDSFEIMCMLNNKIGISKEIKKMKGNVTF